VKLGPTLAPAPLPVEPVGAVQPPAQVQQSEAERSQAAGERPGAEPQEPAHKHAHGHGHAHAHGQRKGAQFRPSAQGAPRSAQAGAPARGNAVRGSPGPRRTAGAASADVSNLNDGDTYEGSDAADDFDARRLRAGYTLHTDPSKRDDAERGGSDEGGTRERHFAVIQRARLSGLPGGAPGETSGAVSGVAAEGARAALRAPNPVEALAAHLAGMVRGIAGPGEQAALSALVLSVSRAWLAGQGKGASGGTTRLADVRAALLEGCKLADGAQSQRLAAACVWLPVFLLNLDRPRTQQQRQQAVERMGMLERTVSSGRRPDKD
jgi:hypothetical protein